MSNVGAPPCARMNSGLTFDQIETITGGKFGVMDVACPFCGPEKRSSANQARKVLRVWRSEEAFATYRCARCEQEGFARRSGVAGARRAVEPSTSPSHSVAADRQRDKARWLWSRRQPLEGSIAERYLRNERSYGGDLPERVGFLPAAGKHCACMISALGLVDVQAVHLTKLATDGRKAGTESDKIVVGSPRGAPIALIPVNDGLGLVIAEGIEDALSAHEATGLGAWAAASAPLLPYLADVVPNYVECVTIMVDDDKAGRRRCDSLAERLEARGIEIRLFYANRSRAA